MTKTAQNDTKAMPKKRTRKLTAEAKYFIIQKIIGVVVLVLGIIAGVWVESIAPLFFGCGVGAVFIFSKEKILMASDVYWKENPTESDKED